MLIIYICKGEVADRDHPPHIYGGLPPQFFVTRPHVKLTTIILTIRSTFIIYVLWSVPTMIFMPSAMDTIYNINILLADKGLIVISHIKMFFVGSLCPFRSCCLSAWLY